MPRHTGHDEQQPDDDFGAASERTPGVPDLESSRGKLGGAASDDEGNGTEEVAQQLVEMQDKWLRARADIENVRRAMRLDVDSARRYGAAPVLTGLLEVLDNLQRALAAPPADIDPTFLHGLQLIEQQFLSVLAAHGVTAVPAARGQVLDPNSHRALMEQPSNEVAPGAILHVAAPGYRLHDRLLREAQVIVARAAPRDTD